MKLIKSFLALSLVATTLYNCGSVAPILSTPIENIDKTPLKVSELTEAEKQAWGH